MNKEPSELNPLKHIHPSDSDEMAKQRTAPDPRIAVNLTRLMEDQGLKQSALAARSGVGQSTISRILHGDDSPTSRTLAKLATALSVTVDQFFRHENAKPVLTPIQPNSDNLQLEPVGKTPVLNNVPVVGTAKLSEFGYFEQLPNPAGSPGGHVEVSGTAASAFALRVRGDAMHPAIRDGWIVVVEPAAPLTPGEFVMIALADGRQLISELLYERADSVSVIAINGDQRTSIHRSDIKSIHAIGPLIPPSRWKAA